MKNLIIITIVLWPVWLYSQLEALSFSSDVKWTVNKKCKNNENQIGIDTTNGDVIILSSNEYLRINNSGDTIERLVIDLTFLDRNCGDDGYKLTGHWIARYETGEVKEIGKILCNRKMGEWIYFYRNGQLMKFENYVLYDKLLGKSYPAYLDGRYKEYYKDGEVKISGEYKVVKKYSEVPRLDFETMESYSKCCYWVPMSIKWGKWRVYDNGGKLVKTQEYSFNLDTVANTKDISDDILLKDIVR